MNVTEPKPNLSTQAALRTLRIITGAFAASITFSCALYFSGLLLPPEGQEINQMIGLLLTVLGFLALAVSKPVTNFVGKTMSKNQGKDPSANPAAVYVLSKIVGLAIVESGSLFGLVASVNSRSSTPCLLLGLGALFCLFNQWPSEQDLEESRRNGKES